MQQRSRGGSDWVAVDSLIEKSGVTTLLCSDQESKLLFLSRLISTISDQGGVTVYIDLDTMFTIFLERGGVIRGAENVFVIRPEGGAFDDAVADVCSLNLPVLKLIVFDSTTTFYSLEGRGGDASSLNMKLGLYLALLRRLALKGGGRLVFTSMRRAKRGQGGGVWSFSYSGGRLLKRRSDLILELSIDGGYLAVSVVKCRDGLLQGRRFTFHS